MKEIIVGGLVGFLLIELPPWTWIKDQIKYSFQGYEKITVLHEPRDCDWGHAPLGDKSCKYIEAPVFVQPAIENTQSFGHGVVVVSWQKVDDN
jgi:hypothetical protein